jgi:hypothetical protein
VVENVYQAGFSLWVVDCIVFIRICLCLSYEMLLMESYWPYGAVTGDSCVSPIVNMLVLG